MTGAGEDRLGPYRLVHQLGEGGMGVVHLALDPTGRAVAIKVLRPHIAHDRDARTRLAREVQTLARVQDARVAAVLDADTDGDRPYIVTRYVPGPPLDQVVADTGPLRGDALLRLGRGLSDALTAIHRAGVVHRDLKPANVLLLDGDPVVIDFGIAHVADDIRLTMTGPGHGHAGLPLAGGRRGRAGHDGHGLVGLGGDAGVRGVGAAALRPRAHGRRARPGAPRSGRPLGGRPAARPGPDRGAVAAVGRASARRRDRRRPRPLRRRCAGDGVRPGGRAHRGGGAGPHQGDGAVRRAPAR